MVNGYADVYKDNRRKHLRTHTMSYRSIITTATKPALSTVASNRRIKLRAITVNATIGTPAKVSK